MLSIYPSPSSLGLAGLCACIDLPFAISLILYQIALLLYELYPGLTMDHNASTSTLPESRILIIMTGGTICMKRSDLGFVPARGFLDAALAPRPSFNDGSSPDPIEVMTRENHTEPLRSLRTPCSQYGRHVRYAVFEFEKLLDSSSIDAKGWTEIAETIFWNYKLFDAFVVLHGTDSLAYTCSALSFMLQHLGKPVVLTGSQAPMLELQSDATDNLLNSLMVCGMSCNFVTY